ncbi:hypothetical protein F5X96DRAFT_402209 [Biscogniauxia mediterranea]|nr:hypothetical protein F5X96DRAFT_402209 [Biscogniauxia mediterranea]
MYVRPSHFIHRARLPRDRPEAEICWALSTAKVSVVPTNIDAQWASAINAEGQQVLYGRVLTHNTTYISSAPPTPPRRHTARLEIFDNQRINAVIQIAIMNQFQTPDSHDAFESSSSSEKSSPRTSLDDGPEDDLPLADLMLMILSEPDTKLRNVGGVEATWEQIRDAAVDMFLEKVDFFHLFWDLVHEKETPGEGVEDSVATNLHGTMDRLVKLVRTVRATAMRNKSAQTAVHSV